MIQDYREHSARVRIWLEVGPLCVSVAQVGECSLVLDEKNATFRFSGVLLGHLIVIVDDEALEYPVALRHQRGRTISFDHISDESCALSNDPLEGVPF